VALLQHVQTGERKKRELSGEEREKRTRQAISAAFLVYGKRSVRSDQRSDEGREEKIEEGVVL